MSTTLTSILSLVFVLALIPASMWLIRRLGGAGMRSQGGPIDIRASVAVGPRERIAIVQVGERALLVGITAHTLTTLAEFDQPPLLEENAPASFASLLKGVGKP